jgi:hypothetical protein
MTSRFSNLHGNKQGVSEDFWINATPSFLPSDCSENLRTVPQLADVMG